MLLLQYIYIGHEPIFGDPIQQHTFTTTKNPLKRQGNAQS